MIRTFTTIFSKCKNVDILKMPGMTPFYISKLSGAKIKCKLVCLNNDDFKYHNEYKEFYDLIILDKEKRHNKPYLPVFGYLFKNAAKTDILNLYHLDIETLMYAFVYKLLNGKGKILLELDADERIKEFFKNAERSGLLKITNKIRPLKSFILNGLIKLSDYIACETGSIYEYLRGTGNKKLNLKLFINPYGINADEIENLAVKGTGKENIAITIGRIGSYQKNNEMLIDAITRIQDYQGWKFYFIGPIEKEFNDNIKTLYKKYPALKDSVFFTGEIRDRKLLIEYMQKAKIFCLTSRYESWGIVLNEAAYCGCYIISTDTGCAREVIENIAEGEIINDAADLHLFLEKAIKGDVNFDNVLKNGALEYVKNNSWEKTIGFLMKKIIPEL